jgi:hypothetical protein
MKAGREAEANPSDEGVRKRDTSEVDHRVLAQKRHDVAVRGKELLRR